MKLKKVYLLAGVPGSGKSTWVRSQLVPGAEWISRDKVRFAILADKANVTPDAEETSHLDKVDYFAYEDDVFDTFINYINQTLENENIHTIYIDATHLNKRSRDKVLNKVRKNNIAELNCVCFDVPLETCYSRNHLRKGLAHVPQTAIANMYQYYRIPEKGVENFNHIIIVDENGDTKEV